MTLALGFPALPYAAKWRSGRRTDIEPIPSEVNAMANRTSKKPAKVAKKAAAERVAAKAAKPRKTAPKSQFRKVARPSLLAGGDPPVASKWLSSAARRCVLSPALSEPHKLRSRSRHCTQ